MIPGLLRYENDIALNEEVVLMTTKGAIILVLICSSIESMSQARRLPLPLRK